MTFIIYSSVPFKDIHNYDLAYSDFSGLVGINHSTENICLPQYENFVLFDSLGELLDPGGILPKGFKLSVEGADLVVYIDYALVKEVSVDQGCLKFSSVIFTLDGSGDTSSDCKERDFLKDVNIVSRGAEQIKLVDFTGMMRTVPVHEDVKSLNLVPDERVFTFRINKREESIENHPTVDTTIDRHFRDLEVLASADLILIRGLPGSGKTVLAEALIKEGYADYHLEADMFFIRADGQYKYNRELAPTAHEWCQLMTTKGLEEGKKVVVSNTFVQHWELEYYRTKVAELGLNLIEVTARGNYDSVHDVPVESIERMKANWEH